MSAQVWFCTTYADVQEVAARSGVNNTVVRDAEAVQSHTGGRRRRQQACADHTRDY
jgi:hypothetical protein